MKKKVIEIRTKIVLVIIGIIKPILLFLQRFSTTNIPSITSLSPRSVNKEEDIERIKPYLELLKSVIDEKDVNNIALTGNYGSGKSTVLKTFQNQNPEYYYLNISLASFKDVGQSRKSSECEDNDKKIEISILQQMFYHISASTLPDSRFKRIKNTAGLKTLSLIIEIVIWLLSIFILFGFRYIENLNPKNLNFSSKNLIQYIKDIDWRNLHNFLSLISIGIFLLGLVFLLRFLYRYFRNSKISKISIQGELEIGDSEDKSIFNKYLDEILYFFERTNFNVVIIEDLDRFEKTDIFVKLREINLLINNSTVIKRQIKFVYAIKDELFKDKNERVKFFDYIIPVIPYIDPSNARDQITRLINEAGIKDKLSTELTSDIVTFIDDIDMRLLINIFNEYRLYSQLLDPNLDQDKLFSILVYKNLDPNDFACLIKREGYLFEFLSNKDLFLNGSKRKFENQIKFIDDQIVLIENETDKPIRELRAIYINNLISKLERFHSFTIDNNQVSIVDALEDKYFTSLKDASPIQYNRYDNQPYASTVSLNPIISTILFTQIEKEISSKLTYDQREEILKSKVNNKINALKLERKKIKQKISDLELMSIKEIFIDLNPDEYLGDFKNNQLVRNLLLNGYIDENYNNFTSLFHGITLTINDYTFERNVKSKSNLPFSHEINNIETLVRRISANHFRHESILNLQLLTYLLDNSMNSKEKLDNFWSVLGVDNERQFEFIQEYIKEHPDKVDTFIKNLCKYKPTLWEYIYEKSHLPDEEINKLLGYIFSYANNDDILKFESLLTLKEYLQNMPDFFEFCSLLKNEQTITGFIKDQHLLFNKLDKPANTQSELFKVVYENNLYIINHENIITIASSLNKPFNETKLSTSHYSTLLDSELTKLLVYIDENIEDYISQVMLLQKDNTKESEKVIIRLLNREDINIELKKQIIKSQDARINDLSNVEIVDIKKELIKEVKCEVTWENVFDYYDSIDIDKFDDNLIEFFNQQESYETLSKSKLNHTNSEYIKKFSYELLLCNDLENVAYSALISSIPYTYDSPNLDNLSTVKIAILTSKKILDLTNSNITSLREKEAKLPLGLMEIHQDILVDKMDELDLDDIDYLSILKSLKIKNSNKFNFINKIDSNRITSNIDLAKTITDLLPLNNKYIKFDYDVLSSIFQTDSTEEKKINLLNYNFETIQDNQIQLLLEDLGYKYQELFLKQHKPKFINKAYNRILFEKLQARGLIIRSEIDEKKEIIKVFAKY